MVIINIRLIPVRLAVYQILRIPRLNCPAHSLFLTHPARNQKKLIARPPAAYRNIQRLSPVPAGTRRISPCQQFRRNIITLPAYRITHARSAKQQRPISIRARLITGPVKHKQPPLSAMIRPHKPLHIQKISSPLTLPCLQRKIIYQNHIIKNLTINRHCQIIPVTIHRRTRTPRIRTVNPVNHRLNALTQRHRHQLQICLPRLRQLINSPLAQKYNRTARIAHTMPRNRPALPRNNIATRIAQIPIQSANQLNTLILKHNQPRISKRQKNHNPVITALIQPKRPENRIIMRIIIHIANRNLVPPILQIKPAIKLNPAHTVRYHLNKITRTASRLRNLLKLTKSPGKRLPRIPHKRSQIIPPQHNHPVKCLDKLNIPPNAHTGRESNPLRLLPISQPPHPVFTSRKNTLMPVRITEHTHTENLPESPLSLKIHSPLTNQQMSRPLTRRCRIPHITIRYHPYLPAHPVSPVRLTAPVAHNKMTIKPISRKCRHNNPVSNLRLKPTERKRLILLILKLIQSRPVTHLHNTNPAIRQSRRQQRRIRQMLLLFKQKISRKLPTAVLNIAPQHSPIRPPGNTPEPPASLRHPARKLHILSKADKALPHQLRIPSSIHTQKSNIPNKISLLKILSHHSHPKHLVPTLSPHT